MFFVTKETKLLKFFAVKEPKLYGEGILRHPLCTPGFCLIFSKKNQNLLFFAVKEPNPKGCPAAGTP